MDSDNLGSPRSSLLPNRDPYLIKSVVHASELMAAFESPDEILTARELISRSCLSRGIVFRLLYTLERSGVIAKSGENQFRLLFRRIAQRRWKVGYGAPGIDTQFTREVANSLRCAVEQSGTIELTVLDNRFDPSVAIRNAEQFIRERADLVIEFQIDETVALTIANLYRGASIPFIAVNNPLPGATYYGANNYEAGLIGGRHLGRWAQRNWQGEVDEIVLLELTRAGTIPKTRIAGMLAGIREALKNSVERARLTQLDGNGQFDHSWQVMRSHLRHNRAQRVLVGAMNDMSALGAIRAFQETGRDEHCAVLGQNGSLDAREELRSRRSPFIGSVAYFPEKYGSGLVQLATDILNRRFVSPAVFTNHVLLTADNVDRLYPNDTLLVRSQSVSDCNANDSRRGK